MTPTEAVKAKLQSGELMDWKKAWAVSVDRTPQWGHWLLAKLHKNGEIHIAKWQRGDSGPPRPFYRWGSGEDARKPKALTRPAISRRYRKRAAEQDPIKVAARSDLKRLTRCASSLGLQAGEGKREARQGFFGRHRSISSRSAGTPAMRTFSHCARVRRSVPCTNSLSGATGGRPVFFRSSMPELSVAREQLASVAFSCHNNAMQTAVKTLKIRVKDKHASVLRRMARDVNQVFNFANETSSRAIRERGKWLSAYDLQKLTAGYSKCDGVTVGSGTVQLVAQVPMLRPLMPRMATCTPMWAALMERWDEIEACHLEEVGLGWAKAKSAPKTYDLMRSVIDAARKKDPS